MPFSVLPKRDGRVVQILRLLSQWPRQENSLP